MSNKLPIYMLAGSLSLVAGPALAGHGGSMEKCLKAASAIKSGDYVKVEYLSFSDFGFPVYEVEVMDKDGNEWELMCNAKEATIIEVEREVESSSDPLFKNRMKVSEAEAKKTATAMYPGKIEETEYEVEFDGEPVYEIDIVDDDGTEWKVEVSA
ncbi:MAG: PepSY domain-containing protein, partial [Gammaproteobacteria bacterium]